MARGKLEKTKLKEAITEAVRTTTAYSVAGEVLEQSKRKAHEKKPLSESLREHIGKAIDRIDPIEMMAILSGTYIIHETIKTTESLLARINPVVTKTATDWFLFGPGIAGGMLGIDIGNEIVKLLGLKPGISSNLNYDPTGAFIGPVAPGKTTSPTPLGSLTNQGEILLWMVSFVIAYIGIKNAGKIGSSILDITGILGFLGL